MNNNRDAMIGVALNKLKGVNQSLTKDSRIGHLSLNEAARMHSNSDDRTFLFSMEMIIDDARWPAYFMKGDNLNFYDLLPKSVEKIYPEYFKKVTDKINSKLHSFDVEKEGNIHSQSNEINSLINARDQLFNSIKSQVESKIINLEHLSHLAYVGTRAMLAYSRTINDSNYSGLKDCDDAFQNLNNNGFFKSTKPLNALFLYTGPGYLENAWAEKLDVQSKTFIDNSGLNLHYLFSDRTAFHSKELINLDNFYDSMKSFKKQHSENIIIKNNGIQNEDIDSVFEEMELVGLLSRDFKIFYTVPIINNVQNQYSGLDNAQMQNFKKELLLTDNPDLQRIVDVTETAVGRRYDVGLEAKKDVLLHNQYMNESAMLNAGTKLYRFQTWQYNTPTLLNMAELARLKLDVHSDTSSRASLHN